MKTKTLKLTAILLIFAGVFTACEEKIEPFLNIDKTSITVPAEGGTFTILVSSNGNWTAVVQDAASNLWLTLNNTSGINDGVITVNVEKNPLSEIRSATIQISMGSLSEYVLVEQEEAEKITLANTQWRLAGFVDKQTGVLRAPEPLEDCFRCLDWCWETNKCITRGYECFTIIFETDRLRGFTTSNAFWGDYKIDYTEQSIQLSSMFFQAGGERHLDGTLFSMALSFVHSFCLQQNELRLYSTIPEDFPVRYIIDHVNNNYLLLKRVEHFFIPVNQ